jgi:hypothetical protein
MAYVRSSTVVEHIEIVGIADCKEAVAVTADEYERVRQCLTDPKEKPSEAALEAAEFLRSLPIPPSTR